VQDVLKEKSCADQNDSEFQPELVRRNSSPQKWSDADGIANCQPKEDGPQNIFKMREGNAGMAGAKSRESVFKELAEKTDAE
jgi:hypothetical protein